MSISTSCPICNTDFPDVDVSKTGHIRWGVKHIFCKDCIEPWLRVKAECPVCRTALNESGLRELINPNFSMLSRAWKWCKGQQPGMLSDTYTFVKLRLNEGKYVPVGTETVGLIQMGYGGLFLGVGCSLAVFHYFQNKKITDLVREPGLAFLGFSPRSIMECGVEVIKGGGIQVFTLPYGAYKVCRTTLGKIVS